MPSIAHEIRAQLDLSTYVRLLHQAAITGHLAILTIDGHPTGNFMPLSAEQRMETMKFLINKVVPDPPREIHHAEASPANLAQDPAAAMHMTTEQLLRIVNATPLASPEPAELPDV